MANLFGLDIAGIINTEIANAGGVLTGTLTQIVPGTRTGGQLTGGTNPTTTTHTFQGFVETKATRVSQGQHEMLLERGMAILSILGDSINVIPEANDTAVIDGRTWTLVELRSLDPALAIYEFAVEAA